MTPHRRSLRPLGGPLRAAREQWAPETLLAEVQRVWPEVVGATIASQATPVSERARMLTVSCSASVWAQELDLMAPTILERLNSKLTRGALARLRCVTLPARD